jgi:2-phospho-L-lactate guanylyltransferase (CobY/MobA/RfbA family)
MNIYIYSHDIHTHTDIYDITYLNKRCNKTYYTSKRDLPTEQKRSTSTGSQQNLLYKQKRPTNRAKETY